MAGNNWTPEQLNAINAETGTILVSAAAGSGKTSVLVERIVRKLTSSENPCEPDELLVVTFTNAAAAEMRSRIYKRLGELMKNSGSDRLRLMKLRSRLEEMQVSTMDAFCMKLVKDNYSKCDIEPDFSVLDSGIEKALKNEAVGEIIEELYAEGSDSFRSLARLFESGRNDINLINGIFKLSDFSMSEPKPEEWLDSVADNFLFTPAAESVWGRVLRSYFIEGIDYALALSEKFAEEFSQCEGLEEKYPDMYTLDRACLEKISDSIKNGSWDDMRLQLETGIADLKSRRFKRDGFGDDYHRNTAKEVRGAIKDVVTDIIDSISVSEEENREDTEVLRPIAQELIKTVKMFNCRLLEKKREKNAYSFSDISHFALSLLSDSLSPDGKTELARELSDNLREILIDEYQDTNRAQDTLFTCISKNGGNMFMVGDVKQSIYRFRLASPEIFIEKFEKYPYFDGSANPSKIILSKNFRSRRGVTQAVNFMFSALMSKNCGEIVYNDDEKLNFAADYEDDGTPDTELHFIDNVDENEYTTEAEYIARLIKSKMEEGLTVHKGKETRKAEYSDFCILLRVAKKTAPIYAEVLRRHSIPVSLDSNENFFESPEIRMAVSILKIINNPSCDIDMLSVLMSPVFGFSPDETAKIRIAAREYFGGKKYSLYNAVRMCAQNFGGKYAEFVNTITHWRKTSACETAAQTLSRIYDETCLESIVGSMPDGVVRRANLRTLLISAEKYSASGNAGLSGFVRYIDTLIENAGNIGTSSACAQNNGVSIMTMHRSKGLEFPFVIIAGLTKKPNSRTSSPELLVNHKLGIGLKRREPENIKLYSTLSYDGVNRANLDGEISESLRIFYVAMTRAKEKLYIVSAPKKCSEEIEKLQIKDVKSAVLPSYYVKNASCAWQWFVMAFASHPDASALRIGSYKVRNADFCIKAVLVPPAEVTEEDSENTVVDVDETLKNSILEKMDFNYKYNAVASLASKHTASNIGSEHFTPASFGKSVPGFMFTGALSPAEAGTATHLFMQYCDFSVCEYDVQSEINRLVSCGKLSQQQAAAVNVESVEKFFASDVYSRIKNSDCVIRERQFTVARKISELEENIPDEFADERTVVIGKTDLIFTENSNAVIVDYKTDNITDIGVLRDRYRRQMELYVDAVRRSLGLDVRECILFSIKLGKSISL